MKQDYIFSKAQRLSNFIESDKYDNILPLKITKNRPYGIIKELITMMKNDFEVNDVKNFIQPYLVN